MGNTGSIPGSRKSPAGGNDNPLQHSCCEIPQTEERGGLQSWGHKESDTAEQLSTHTDRHVYTRKTGIQPELTRLLAEWYQAELEQYCGAGGNGRYKARGYKNQVHQQQPQIFSKSFNFEKLRCVLMLRNHYSNCLNYLSFIFQIRGFDIISEVL